MASKIMFDLENYIGQICENCHIDPESAARSNNYMIPLNFRYRDLLRMLLMQHWNPFSFYFHVRGLTVLPARKLDEALLMLKESKFDSYLDPLPIVYPTRLNTQDFVSFEDFNLRFGTGQEGINDILNWPGAIIISERGTFAERLLVAKISSLSHHLSKPEGVYRVFTTYKCTGANDATLYSEIFGYSQNSFEGANFNMPGKIEMTSEGFMKEENEIKPANTSVKYRFEDYIVLYNFQKAGEEFQKAVLNYVHDGKFFRIGETTIRKGKCSIICQMEGAYNDPKIEILSRVRLRSSRRRYKLIYFPPLRDFRSDIPYFILVWTNQLKSKHRFEGKILFPHTLYHYWLMYEQWPSNHDQLRHELIGYIENFIAFWKLAPKDFLNIFDDLRNGSKSKTLSKTPEQYETNKKMCLELIKLSVSWDFSKYYKSLGPDALEPYEILDEDDIYYKPYLSYALRHFNKESQEWDYDRETLKKVMEQELEIFKKRLTIYSMIIDSEDSPKTGANNTLNKRDPNRIKNTRNLNEFIRICALTRSEGSNQRATGEITLVHRSEKDEDSLTVKFKRTNTKMFTLLLFLIMEREANEFDWLSFIDKPRESLKWDEVERVCELCNIPKRSYGKCCSWHAPIEGRNWTVSAINSHFKENGLGENIIVRIDDSPDESTSCPKYRYKLQIDVAEIISIDDSTT